MTRELKVNNTVMMTFDVWFRSTKRPMHHKAGMRLFADTKRKRAKEDWDKVFQKY